jgi:hypothetical protein
MGQDPIKRPTFGNFDHVVPNLYWMKIDYLPFVILLQFNLKYVAVFADVAFDPRTEGTGPLKLEFWNEKGFDCPWRHIIIPILFS